MTEEITTTEPPERPPQPPYCYSPEALEYGFRTLRFLRSCGIASLVIRCLTAVIIVGVICAAWVVRSGLLAGKVTVATIEEHYSIWAGIIKPVATATGNGLGVAGAGVVVAALSIWLLRRTQRRCQAQLEELGRLSQHSRSRRENDRG